MKKSIINVLLSLLLLLCFVTGVSAKEEKPEEDKHPKNWQYDANDDKVYDENLNPINTYSPIEKENSHLSQLKSSEYMFELWMDTNCYVGDFLDIYYNYTGVYDVIESWYKVTYPEGERVETYLEEESLNNSLIATEIGTYCLKLSDEHGTELSQDFNVIERGMLTSIPANGYVKYKGDTTIGAQVKLPKGWSAEYNWQVIYKDDIFTSVPLPDKTATLNLTCQQMAAAELYFVDVTFTKGDIKVVRNLAYSFERDLGLKVVQDPYYEFSTEKGGSYELKVFASADNDVDITYKWYFEDDAIDGANSNSYLFEIPDNLTNDEFYLDLGYNSIQCVIEASDKDGNKQIETAEFYFSYEIGQIEVPYINEIYARTGESVTIDATIAKSSDDISIDYQWYKYNEDGELEVLPGKINPVLNYSLADVPYGERLEFVCEYQASIKMSNPDDDIRFENGSISANVNVLYFAVDELYSEEGYHISFPTRVDEKLNIHVHADVDIGYDMFFLILEKNGQDFEEATEVYRTRFNESGIYELPVTEPGDYSAYLYDYQESLYIPIGDYQVAIDVDKGELPLNKAVKHVQNANHSLVYHYTAKEDGYYYFYCDYAGWDDEFLITDSLGNELSIWYEYFNDDFCYQIELEKGETYNFILYPNETKVTVTSKLALVNGIEWDNNSKTSDEIEISWHSPKGYLHYDVYRSTNKKTYTHIATGYGDFAYDDDAEYGKTYYYKIVCTNGSDSITSSVLKVTYKVEKPGISVEKTSNSINIYADNDYLFDDYEFYYATSKTGKYKKLENYGSNYCSFNTATYNKTYYFKTRGYTYIDGKKIYSPYSSIKSAKISMKTPKILEIVQYGESAVLSWSANDFSLYEVYRATSKTGKYSYVDTSYLPFYLDTGLTPNKTYYYKVRTLSINDESGKEYRSSFSKAKSVKMTPAAIKVSKYEYPNSMDVVLTLDSASVYDSYRVVISPTKNGTFEEYEVFYGLDDDANTPHIDLRNTELEYGQTYYVKVKGIVQNDIFGCCESDWSAAYKCTYTYGAPVVTYSCKSDSITLTVDAQCSRDIICNRKYEFYRSTNNKKFELIHTDSYEGDYMVYIDDTVSPNKTYYYKVVITDEYDGYSRVFTASLPKAVKSIIATPKVAYDTYGGKLLTMVTPVNDTFYSGYETWYSTSKSGKYKKLTSADEIEFVGKLTGGKTYYFKTRAYYINNSSGQEVKEYSAYTTAKKIKIAK